MATNTITHKPVLYAEPLPTDEAALINGDVVKAPGHATRAVKVTKSGITLCFPRRFIKADTDTDLAAYKDEDGKVLVVGHLDKAHIGEVWEQARKERAAKQAAK